MACSVAQTAAVVAVACVLLAGSVRSGPAEVPGGLTICKRNDPEFLTCLKEAVTTAFPLVANGLPTLNILPTDPLDIKHLLIGQGTGPVKMNLEFNDVQMLGLGDAWMESIDGAVEDGLKITGRVKFNKPIRIVGPYKVSGSVLVLPISGDGNTNITLNNLIADIVIEGDKIQKGGEDYIKIKTWDLELTVSHLHVDFTNLFNGDKALGDTMNNFLNENWQEIYKELEPAFEETLAAIFQQITARFFQKVPYEKVFPLM